MTAAMFAVPEPEPTPEPPMPKVTERDMLDLLMERYSATNPGNRPRFATATHVRSAAGFDAMRTCDFIAMDLWPSKGLELHGHEVKVSRSDWLRELKEPAKSEAFRRYMDRWWLVVPDRRIVRDDLPDGWGLIVGKRVCRPAPRLSPERMPRTMMAALLRAVMQTAQYEARQATR